MLSIAPILELKSDLLLDKSIAIYGGSASGKTTLIRHILFLLSDHIDTAIVYCPSDMTNKSYSGDGLIPPVFIHEKIEPKDLKDIFERQQAITETCEPANDIHKLRALYCKIRSSEVDNTIENLQKKLEEHSKNPSLPAETKENLRADTEKFIKAIYKHHLSNNLAKIEQVATPAERNILKDLNTNPRLLLIFDDCTEQLMKVCGNSRSTKNGATEAGELFYRGRHCNITIVLAVHSEATLAPDFRKNIHLNIFCDRANASTFFTRANSGFGTEIKNTAALAIGETFEKKHHKLLYIKEKNAFHAIIASLHPEKFQFGSKEYHELGRILLEEDDAGGNTKNRFLNRFRQI